MNRSDPAAPRRRVRYGGALVVIAAIACYANSFGAPFVYDGATFVRDNPAVHNPLRVDQIASFAASRFGGYWTFACNYAVHGTDVWGYHAVNLAIHVGCALLLFGVVRRTLVLPNIGFAEERALAVSLIAALLWVAHPLMTQVVTNVYQRFESLASLSLLGSLYCFLRAFADGPFHLRWAAASVVSCWLGTTCKEFAALSPLIVLWFDFVCLRHDAESKAVRRRYYAALFGAVPLGALGMALQGRHYEEGGIGIVENLTSWEYFRSQPEVLLHYVRLVIWPVGLCFDYAWPKATDPLRIAIYGGLVSLVAGVTLWGLVRRRPCSVLGGAFFLILAPTSSIIPIVDLAVEHRMYLPSAAVLIGVVLAVDAGVCQWNSRRGAATTTRWAVAATAAILVALTAATIHRNSVYASEETLWTDVLLQAPHNSRAHANLGVALKQRRDFVAADQHFLEAIRLKPNEFLPHYNLGASYFVQRRFDEAEPHLLKAYALRPNDALNLAAIGMLRGVQGRLNESEDYFRRSLKLDPSNATTRRYLQAVLQTAVDGRRSTAAAATRVP